MAKASRKATDPQDAVLPRRIDDGSISIGVCACLPCQYRALQSSSRKATDPQDAVLQLRIDDGSISIGVCASFRASRGRCCRRLGSIPHVVTIT